MNPHLTNPNIISFFIRKGQRIRAIKEFRSQTGWGLKDSKNYLDNYEMGTVERCKLSARRFIKEHSIEFITIEEMTI